MLELKRQMFARVVLPYAVFAGLWIYLSDQLLAVFLSDPLTLTRFQTYKGLIFIFVTAALLYLLLRHQLSLHDRAQAERERMNTRNS